VWVSHERSQNPGTRRTGVNQRRLQQPYPLRGCNSDLAQYSNTPTPQHSKTPRLQYSNTPSLHHSNTPSLHHSITPSLHHSARLDSRTRTRTKRLVSSGSSSLPSRQPKLFLRSAQVFHDQLCDVENGRSAGLARAFTAAKHRLTKWATCCHDFCSG
jgi:hypothetical protein